MREYITSQRDFMNSRMVLKSEDWRKCYILSDNLNIPGTSVQAEENGYYIFDEKVSKEEYDLYSADDSDRPVVYAYSELTSLMRSFLYMDWDVYAFDFPKMYIFVLEHGVRRAENPNYEQLCSFKITKVMKAPDFIQYFFDHLLDEYKSFGLITKSDFDKCAVSHASDRFSY